MSNEAKRSTRKGRSNHPIEFKRRLAQQACEAGVSVLTYNHERPNMAIGKRQTLAVLTVRA